MFVNYNPGDRYYMEFEIRQNKSKSILQNKTIDLSVTMNLQWNMTNSRAGRVVSRDICCNILYFYCLTVYNFNRGYINR